MPSPADVFKRVIEGPQKPEYSYGYVTFEGGRYTVLTDGKKTTGILGEWTPAAILLLIVPFFPDLQYYNDEDLQYIQFEGFKPLEDPTDEQ